MDAQDATDLRSAIASPGITTTVIGKVLRDLGHKIGDDAIRRHKRGVCSCEPR